MILRKYDHADLHQLAELFHDTVHSVNASDYTAAQLAVWAPENADLSSWGKVFEESFCLVAETDGKITGFGNIYPSGYLDRLYVHKDYQRQGIATALCDYLEKVFPVEKITVHASLTAKPFFEHRCYTLIKSRQVERGGIFLTNYLMEKVFEARG